MIMMLMMALASLHPSDGAVDGLSSLLVRVEPYNASSTCRGSSTASTPKLELGTLTLNFDGCESLSHTLPVVAGDDGKRITSIHHGGIRSCGHVTTGTRLTKSGVMEADGKKSKSTFGARELRADEGGSWELMRNSGTCQMSEEPLWFDRKVSKNADLACAREQFLSDAENNIKAFSSVIVGPDHCGADYDKECSVEPPQTREFVFSGDRMATTGATLPEEGKQSRGRSHRGRSVWIDLFWLDHSVHVFDLGVGKRSKGFVGTRRQYQSGRDFWLGLAACLVPIGILAVAIGALLSGIGGLPLTLYNERNAITIKDIPVNQISVTQGEFWLDFSLASAVTMWAVARMLHQSKAPNAWPRGEQGPVEDVANAGPESFPRELAEMDCSIVPEKPASFHDPEGVREGGRFIRVGRNIPLRAVLFLANLAYGESVTCRTCFDQITGCTGGNACPLISTTTANGAILAGVAAGTATVLVARNVFPLRFTRVLHRGILDSLLVVGRRPPPGTPVDIGTLTTAQLSDPVATAGVELDAMLQEVGTRLAAATSQLEVSRLNAITTNMTARQKLNSGAKGAVDLGDGTSAIVGVYRYCVVLALRIVRTKPTDVTVVTEGERAGSSEEGARVVPPAKLSRPCAENEFFGMLTVWTMLLAGLGVAPVLVTGVFLMDVVHNPLQEGTITWQTAFELFLVYLEEVEREAGDVVNLSNVYQRGAQDTFLMRARERTPKAGRSRSIFRREAGDDDDEGAVQWNGSWNRKAKACCISFNIGAKKHPAASLNERGGCKFNHVCDHWVDDKGPSGTCGGDHPRIRCTNPHKCDKKLE